MKGSTSSPKVFIDPVCLVHVKPCKKNQMFTYRLRTYYFCDKFCRKAFEANPVKYLESMSPKRKGWWAVIWNG
jgi:YHS domain-containing protein